MGELVAVGQPKFKPGSLRSLKLTNFMCHESFELTFGSSVNFIIGPNGSGKSALLTAIVYVLGARASATSRAKKQNEFIMYGKKSAKVQLTLHNYETVMELDSAYKPDDYGKKIIIEKRIFDDGVSRLELKSEKGKRVSERKQELDDILEFFGILVNNPICILNQEISKTFLHSNKPEDQFDLFVKATSLEQITEDYNLAQMYHNEWDENNERNKVAFKILDNEYKLCQDKSKFLLNRGKLNDRRDYLSREFTHALCRVAEETANNTLKMKQSVEETINQARKDIQTREVKIKTIEEEIELVKVEIETHTARADEAKKKVEEHKLKDTKIKYKLIENKQRIEKATREVERKMRSVAALEKSLTELKQQFQDQNNLDQDNERRKIEIDSLEKQIAHEKAREVTLRAHTQQLNSSMTDTRTDLHKQTLRVSELKNKVAMNEASLRRLRAGVDNRLRKYGDFMVRIVEEIDKAHKQGRFIKKPIGPLGYYIRLQNSGVAKALEVQLGRTAHAFVCDNSKDRIVLTSVFESCMSGIRSRQPLVITRPFGARHDFRRFKAEHSSYKTLLDYIEVEASEVFNALLDRSNLESVLFIPEYKDAENLMMTPRLIPQNTRCAYTSDASCMFPRSQTGGYKCIAHPYARGELFVENNAIQIKNIEREIANLQLELRDAENIHRELDRSNRAQRAEYDKNQEETRKILETCRTIEQKLLDLRTVVVAEPQEISALEAELENLSRNIGEAKIIIEAEIEMKGELEKELREAAADKVSSIEMLEKIQEEIKSRKTIIESSEKTRQVCLDAIQQKNKLILIKTKESEAADAELNQARVSVEMFKNELGPDFVPPKMLRTVDEIREELSKLKAQLLAEQEEDRDPNEVLSSLRKRMDEIRDLQFLEKQNRSNFDRTHSALQDRKEKFGLLKENTIHSVTTTFSTLLSNMNMKGEMKIAMDDRMDRGELIQKGRTLVMNIDTHHTPSQRVAPVMSDSNNNSDDTSAAGAANRRPSHSQPVPPRSKKARLGGDQRDNQEKENDSMGFRDTRSLSGGERSFTTVAFVVSLWSHCHSPFKLMDEIDVFMDMVTRRVSYNALIRFAQAKEGGGQYLFFSPLELPKFEDVGLEVRVFSMPPIIRKRPYSQMQNGTGASETQTAAAAAMAGGADASQSELPHTPSRLRRI